MDNEQTFTTEDMAILYSTAEASAEDLGYWKGTVEHDVFVGRYVRNSVLPQSL